MNKRLSLIFPILLALFFIVLIISCSTDKSSPTGTDNNDGWQPTSEFYVTFKISSDRIVFTFADIDLNNGSVEGKFSGTLKLEEGTGIGDYITINDGLFKEKFRD